MLEGRLGRGAERARRRRRPPGLDADAPRRGAPARHAPAQAARRGPREARRRCCASATWAGRPTSSPSSCTPTASRSCSRRCTFVRRVERADTRLLDLVRSARTDADRERTVLFDADQAPRPRGRRRPHPPRRARRRSPRACATARRCSPAPTPPASPRSAAPAAAAAAERELQVAARRARPRRRLHVGPGGPWAIPWPIVQCESGGQNLPPNSAGASGYYQFIVATWKGLGGSTPHAYQASKAEQDRLAARLWAGGAGRDNWVWPRSSTADLPDWAARLLEEIPVAHLGLLDEDGEPRVQPVTFARVGDAIVSAIDDKPKRGRPPASRGCGRTRARRSPSTATTPTGRGSRGCRCSATSRSRPRRRRRRCGALQRRYPALPRRSRRADRC